MDFELTDEQRLIQDTVRTFAAERVLPNAIENDIEHRLDMSLIEGMAELGLLGIVIPEEYGGSGARFRLVAGAGGGGPRGAGRPSARSSPCTSASTRSRCCATAPRSRSSATWYGRRAARSS